MKTRLTEMPEAEPSDGAPAAAARRETILMVEDNPDVRTMGEILLLDAGFAVHAVGDAAGALEQVRAGLPFDLLFTDIVMPGGLDGIGLAAEVGRLRPGTPVLLTTGWADRAQAHLDEPLNLDLIAKPYRQVELVHKIRLLLDGNPEQR